MNQVLMRLVVENIAFLELSSDKAVDPDVAVRELEGIAAQLQRLSASERSEFLRFVREVMIPEARGSGDEARAALFSRLQSDMGW